MSVLMAVMVGCVAPGLFAQNPQTSSTNSSSNSPQPILATEAASRYVGGAYFRPIAIEVDADGNIYVAGNNNPPDTPSNFIGGELYKLNPQFEQVFRLPLGDSKSAYLNGMAMDPAGNIYLTGTTVWTNFPTMNPVQAELGGAQDVFLTKVDSDGNMLFSTYLGGSSSETVDVLTVDSDGNAFLAGGTRSADFPTTPNAYMTDFQPSQTSPELYVTKIATGSGTLEYSTGFGTGTPFDHFRGIVEVSGGDVFVLLLWSATDFPVTDDSANGGSGRLFARLSTDGSQLVYATYDTGNASFNLILDGNGDPVLAGGSITTIDPTTNLVISSVPALLGSSVVMSGNGDLVGAGNGGGMPATANGYSSGGSFVVEVSRDGLAVFTSYMPSGTADAVASGPNGGIYLAGTSGLVSRIFPDQTDPLMALPRILGAANAAGPSVISAIAPGEIVSLYGPSIGSQQAATTEIGSDGLVTTTLGGVEVHFNGTPGPLLYTGPTQINAVAPFNWGQGDNVLVEVFHDGDLWSSQTLNPVDVQPGIFRYPAGALTAAALNQDQTINSKDNPAPAGTVVAIFLTGAGEMMGASYQDGQVFDPTTPIADLPVPKLPVVVYTCCGQIPGTTPPPGTTTNPAPVLDLLYAGQAPSSLAGVIQVNLRLPAEPPANSDQAPQSIDLIVGSPGPPTGPTGPVHFQIWMTAAEGQ